MMNQRMLGFTVRALAWETRAKFRQAFTTILTSQPAQVFKKIVQVLLQLRSNVRLEKWQDYLQ
jgi:hypothetical protein